MWPRPWESATRKKTRCLTTWRRGRRRQAPRVHARRQPRGGGVWVRGGGGGGGREQQHRPLDAVDRTRAAPASARCRRMEPCPPPAAFISARRPLGGVDGRGQSVPVGGRDHQRRLLVPVVALRAFASVPLVSSRATSAVCRSRRRSTAPRSSPAASLRRTAPLCPDAEARLRREHSSWSAALGPR